MASGRVRGLWGTLIVLASVFSAEAAVPGKSLDLYVNVPAETPAGSPIYLTGDAPETCSWKPNCLALTKVEASTYHVRLNLAESTSRLNFKITRGSWDTEFSDADGNSIANLTYDLNPGSNRYVYSVINWKDQGPQSVTPDLKYYRGFYSPELQNWRDVEVWLPPGYRAGGRYPVIYMHDGQNVFDPATCMTHIAWGVDRALERLIASGQLATQAIVVGVDSTRDRFPEYDYTQRGPLYADFLIHTLKPFIDRSFRTLPDRDHTYLMGSSMGALISVALLWKHPEVFSRAAALSLPVFIDDHSLLNVVKAGTRPTLPIRLYMDHGTEGMDESYEKDDRPFYELLQGMGLKAPELEYRIYPYASHSEVDWARRVDVPLRFLLNR